MTKGFCSCSQFWGPCPNKAWLSPSAGTAQNTRRPNTWRVCRAWHLTKEVKVLLPGISRAEGVSRRARKLKGTEGLNFDQRIVEGIESSA
jgi:hypothetical protein